MTSLTDPNGMHSLKRSGKSGTVLVAAIERTIRNFVEIGRSAIAECPIAVGNALEQLNETLQNVEHAGKLNIYFELLKEIIEMISAQRI